MYTPSRRGAEEVLSSTYHDDGGDDHTPQASPTFLGSTRKLDRKNSFVTAEQLEAKLYYTERMLKQTQTAHEELVDENSRLRDATDKLQQDLDLQADELDEVRRGAGAYGGGGGAAFGNYQVDTDDMLMLGGIPNGRLSGGYSAFSQVSANTSAQVSARGEPSGEPIALCPKCGEQHMIQRFEKGDLIDRGTQTVEEEPEDEGFTWMSPSQDQTWRSPNAEELVLEGTIRTFDNESPTFEEHSLVQTGTQSLATETPRDVRGDNHPPMFKLKLDALGRPPQSFADTPRDYPDSARYPPVLKLGGAGRPQMSFADTPRDYPGGEEQPLSARAPQSARMKVPTLPSLRGKGGIFAGGGSMSSARGFPGMRTPRSPPPISDTPRIPAHLNQMTVPPILLPGRGVGTGSGRETPSGAGSTPGRSTPAETFTPGRRSSVTRVSTGTSTTTPPASARRSSITMITSPVATDPALVTHLKEQVVQLRAQLAEALAAAAEASASFHSSSSEKKKKQKKKRYEEEEEVDEEEEEEVSSADDSDVKLPSPSSFWEPVSNASAVWDAKPVSNASANWGTKPVSNASSNWEPTTRANTVEPATNANVNGAKTATKAGTLLESSTRASTEEPVSKAKSTPRANLSGDAKPPKAKADTLLERRTRDAAGSVQREASSVAIAVLSEKEGSTSSTVMDAVVAATEKKLRYGDEDEGEGEETEVVEAAVNSEEEEKENLEEEEEYDEEVDAYDEDEDEEESASTYGEVMTVVQALVALLLLILCTSANPITAAVAASSTCPIPISITTAPYVQQQQQEEDVASGTSPHVGVITRTPFDNHTMCAYSDKPKPNHLANIWGFCPMPQHQISDEVETSYSTIISDKTGHLVAGLAAATHAVPGMSWVQLHRMQIGLFSVVVVVAGVTTAVFM